MSEKLKYYSEMKSCLEDLKFMTQLALLQNGSADQQISKIKDKIRKQYSPDEDQNSVEEDIDLVFQDLLKNANYLNVYEQIHKPQQSLTQARKDMLSEIRLIGSKQELYQEYFKSDEFKKFQEQHKDEIIKQYIEDPNNKGEILKMMQNAKIVALKKKILDLYMWQPCNSYVSKEEFEKELDEEINELF